MKKAGVVSLVAFTLLPNVLGTSNEKLVEEKKQLIRTVEYEKQIFSEEDLKEEFDFYERVEKDNGDICVQAEKEFDISLFDEINFVGLDKDFKTITAKYELEYIEEENTIFLTAILLTENNIPLVDKIPGLVSLNKAGEPDVLFVIDGEKIWLSDLISGDSIENTGWFADLFKGIANAVTRAVTSAASTIRNVAQVVLQSIAKVMCNTAYRLIGRKNSAAVGAWFLNMEEEIEERRYSDGSTTTYHTGIYHAKFDCWQQYFGYTDLYDVVFDAFTSMRNDKFEFKTNGQDYVLWCWKGDYLNLGAGSELGIYKRWQYCDEIWQVDKNLALTMTMRLTYNGSTIIDYSPSVKQWWITGFNSNYDDKHRDSLKAYYTVRFITKGYSSSFDNDLWNAFKEKWEGRETNKGNKWNFNYSTSKYATLEF